MGNGGSRGHGGMYVGHGRQWRGGCRARKAVKSRGNGEGGMDLGPKERRVGGEPHSCMARGRDWRPLPYGQGSVPAARDWRWGQELHGKGAISACAWNRGYTTGAGSWSPGQCPPPHGQSPELGAGAWGHVPGSRGQRLRHKAKASNCCCMPGDRHTPGVGDWRLLLRAGARDRHPEPAPTATWLGLQVSAWGQQPGLVPGASGCHPGRALVPKASGCRQDQGLVPRATWLEMGIGACSCMAGVGA